MPGPDGCLLWTAGGTFYLDGNLVRPQRAAWTIHHGPVTERRQGVIATCGRDDCVAIEHLALDSIGPRRTPLRERLDAKTEHGADDDACWLFTGSRSSFGYGHILDEDGKLIAAHRAAWKLANGPIPPDAVVRHRCDNPPCVNPAHLEVGTQGDNVDDMMTRGRGRKANRDTGHHRARLTSAQVEQIRAEYAAGGVTTYELADRYGYSPSGIQRIIKRARLTA